MRGLRPRSWCTLFATVKVVQPKSSPLLHFQLYVLRGLYPTAVTTVTATTFGVAPQSLSAGLRRGRLSHKKKGFHNLVGELARSLGQEFDETGEFSAATASHSPYLLAALRDPPLTALGLDDAKRLQSVAAQLAPQLLVVSPLRRATATILVGFDAAAAAAVPVVATELCREQMGVHVCDQRFRVADLQAEFPRVDYGILATPDGDDGDALWHATRRETYPEMAERAYAFLEWLRARPETDIVVGTHSAFLMCLYNVVLDCGGDASLAAFFATGELRSTVLTWEAQA